MPRYGYLLDTCILSLLARDKDHPGRRKVQMKIASLGGEEPLYMSAVSWGEIEYGWRIGTKDLLRDEDRGMLTRFMTLDVTQNTGKAYAEIKARLFNKYAPKEMRSKKHRVEQLKDPLSGYELGVQENDVWLAAQAFERNLVLVTGDRMRRIKSLIAAVDTLKFENWTANEA
jgi:tRNA(fMet)-specific endonuclease VapC